MDFQEPTGPAITVPDNVRDVFRLIFTADIVEHIVIETNRYAQRIMGAAFYEKWERVRPADIFAYFCIMVMMGLVQLPNLHDYCKKDSLFYCPAIAEHMSRDRFLQIHKYLHFVDNDSVVPPGEPNYDRLCKVRPVLDMIEDRFATIYHPHQQCAIDEAMVPEAIYAYETDQAWSKGVDEK